MTKTNKILWGVGGLLVILFLIFISQNNQKPETIKIGVIFSSSGKGAARGESAQQGLELAFKKLKLNNKNLQLIYQDAPMTDPEAAITAFNQLAQVEKVTAIIGPMGSPAAVPVAPLVDTTKTPVIVHTSSAKKVTQDNDYVFRLWTTAQNYADAISAEIQKRDYKKIAALSSQASNTIDLLDNLKKEVSFVVDEQVGTDVNDFRTQLIKIKEKAPGALFLNLYEGQIGAAAKQAHELGIETPLFTNSVMTALELEFGGAALENIWYPRFAGYNNAVKQEFINTFSKEPPTPESAAAAHDALLVLAEAIQEVGTSGEKIKDYLYSHKFNGSIGSFRFLESGDAVVPLKIKVVKNGKIIDL